AQVYTDLRWFRTLDRESVFTTILRTKVLLGFGVALVTAVLLVANIHVAVRLSTGLPSLRLQDPNLAQLDIGAIAPRLLLFAGPVVGLMTGIAAAGHWEPWLLFRNATDFGVADPILGRDASFYVFDLPILEAAQSLAMWIVVLSIVLAGATYFTRGALHWTGRMFSTDVRARRHFSVLFALLFLILAYDAWIATFQLMYSTTGPVRGASYSDVNARLPMLRVEIGAAILGAVLIAVSMTRKRLVLPAVAVGLYLAVSILGVKLYPAMVQRFSVTPNEAVKEAPYIKHNIDATRKAYGLDEVGERDLSAEAQLTRADIENNRTTIDNIRLWDHDQLLDTFAQIQEIRTYYEFQSVDNDRYEVDGELRQTMLSPRELYTDNLPNRTWINEHFTFTHGYGITLGPVNQATEQGLPRLYIQDMPPKSSVEGLDVTRPGIYFGELSNDHVFVQTKNREFDHPSGEENIYATYEGGAGVRVDSQLMKMLLSLRLGSIKLLLSDDVTEQSRVLLYRKVRDRISQVAPFLRFDRDPYMVLRDDGRLAWVADAYTASARFPYAERPDGRLLNYIRNAAKVVVDAYTGEVDLYAAAPDDPILKAWQKIFPGMFQPLEDMPDDLRRHLRHPQDLFEIQTQMFTVYHMNDPELVYNREDQWEIPTIQRGGRSQQLEPYYTIMRLPGEERSEYIIMLPFTPKQKDNLAAWMVARNDGDHLGQMVVYRFPRDRLVFGPKQVMNRISQDADISRQISLWDQHGSQVILGNLLVIPVEESLIYVSPLYLRSEGGNIPELKRVIVAYGNTIAMEPTLDRALDVIFGDARPTKAPDVPAPEPGAEGEVAAAEPEAEGAAAAEPEPEPVDAELRLRAKRIYDRAVERQREGDWAGYGEQLEELEEVLEELAEGARERRGAEPAEGPTDGPQAPTEGPAKAPAKVPPAEGAPTQ
ncbi:MAG: UPF0182 family protein, partial [Polyangiales bacterium]